MSIPNPSPQPQPQQPTPPQYQQGYRQTPPNPAPNPYNMQGAPQPPATSIPLDQPYYGCPFPEAFVRFWKKYAVFSGRASRSEFWWFALANATIVFALSTIANNADQLSFLPTLWSLATFVPMLALATRRLHDTNKSGWWLFGYYAILIVAFIVFIAALVASVFSLVKYDRSCLVGSYGIYTTTNDTTPYALSRCISSSGLMQYGVLLAISGIVMVALTITYLVFMALNSKPEGMRFDASNAQPQTTAPMYGAPAYDAPAYGAPTSAMPTGTPMYGTPTYGAPAYSQPANQAPIYTAPGNPGAPMAPTAPGAMNVPPYQQSSTGFAGSSTQPTYAAPEAQAYQVPPIPGTPHTPTTPEPAYGDDQAARPSQTAQPDWIEQASRPAPDDQTPFNTGAADSADADAAAQVPLDAAQPGQPSESDAGTGTSKGARR